MSNLTQSFHGAASFTSSKRMNLFEQKQYSPGPYYQLKTTLSTSATKFGKSIRTEPKSENPSVGKYDINYENKRKLKITIKGKRKQDKESSNLGPGSYTIEFPKTTQKFGFGDRFMQTFETETPAPNQYNINAQLKTSLNKMDGFMLGTSKQDSIYPRSKTPAPGQYDINQTLSTCQTFSKATRDVYQINTPGPGSYTIQNREQKGFSFLSKYKAHDPPNFPGPGTYDLENHLKSNGTIKFNSILRQTIFENIRNKSPGPGAYFQEYYLGKSKGTKFYTCPKIFDYSTKVPGPGAYESQQSSLIKQGGVIGKLYRPKRISTTPGPGQYDEQQSKFQKTNTWSKTKRFKDEKLETIGPGKYDTEQSFSKTGVSFAKTKTNRDPVIKQLYDPPGPGHYDLEGELGYIPNYLIKQQK